MIRKNLLVIPLSLAVGLFIASYVGGEKNTPSSADVPEVCTLGHLAKVYEAVRFSHEMHTLVAENCATCHHNSEEGQTPACTECHGTSSGLKDAYHGQCIGCHKKMEMGPVGCTECHMKKISKVSSGEKKKEKGPQTTILNRLENKYQSVTFSHETHSSLAENCSECHHHSPAGQTPACSECHGAPFDPQNLNMPGLKGAYHLQCMGCHQDMGGGPTGCTECHAKKTSQDKQGEEK